MNPVTVLGYAEVGLGKVVMPVDIAAPDAKPYLGVSAYERETRPVRPATPCSQYGVAAFLRALSGEMNKKGVVTGTVGSYASGLVKPI